MTETSIWDDGSIDEVEFLSFSKENNNTVQYKFLENNPEAKVNKFGSPSWGFEVLNLDSQTVVTHTITSKRHMRHLRDHMPLEGNSFCVKRDGEGTDIDYRVTKL